MSDIRKLRPSNYKQWIDSLPDTIYSKSPGTHMVKILDALCGDGGVGGARKREMIKRLQTALQSTSYNYLDTVFGANFGITRLPSEEYSYDVKGLLTHRQKLEIAKKDASYRSRIAKYMYSFNHGGTRKGLKIASEAALGVECGVIDGNEYYQSQNVESGDISDLQALDGESIAKFDTYFIIVYKPDLTARERKTVYDCIRRIKPQGVKCSVLSMNELTNNLQIKAIEPEVLPIKKISSSSDWFEVKKYVTGRANWDYYNYSHLWIEPNVKKEAPTQASVNSQETVNDFTFMIKDVKASSEHEGYYGAKHVRIFKSLNTSAARAHTPAKNAISTASNKRYTASYLNGGIDTIDWNYPIEYTPELNSYFSDKQRAHRYWSSDEREGEEYLELTLSKTLPVNEINIAIQNKPMQVTFMYSKNDGDDYYAIRTNDGISLSFTNREWKDELVHKTVTFPTIEANKIKIIFKRLDQPYLKKLKGGGLEPEKFLYSIEASDVSLFYNILNKSDFVEARYEDIFDNLVETELVEYNTDGINSGGYWCSKPNISQDSIEYIVIDLGEIKKINFIDISFIYGGVQLNLYSSLDRQNWKPYKVIPQVQTNKIKLPYRSLRYLKLEFTKLTAIPYSLTHSEIWRREDRYDNNIQAYVESLGASVFKQTKDGALLSNHTDKLLEPGGYDSLWSSDAYRESEQSQIYNHYGDDTAVEKSLFNSIPHTVEHERNKPRYLYQIEGEHKYKEVVDIHKQEVAYVVAINKIHVGLDRGALVLTDDTIDIPANDGRLIENSQGWHELNNERMGVVSDKEIGMLETNDLYTVNSFTTFEFKTNQRPPRELFKYPSEMNHEWTAFNGTATPQEFGTSGNTLYLETNGGGVVSDQKLIRTNAIANVQLDVFSRDITSWTLEAQDLYDENIFSMNFTTTPGRWNTLGTVFTPQPGGGWANKDYKYRVKIPIQGQIDRDEVVFIPFIDFEALKDAGILQEDYKDIRVVYYNGVENKELDTDITGNMELFFRTQQALPPGIEANGYYDFNLNYFIGSYYVYFGNKLENRDARRNYHKVFDCKEYINTGEQHDRGIQYSNTSYTDIDDYRLSNLNGFITLEYTPEEQLKRVPEGEIGEAEIKFLIDYEDEDKKVQVYTYEEQLTVVFNEDGYESAFVSSYEHNPLFNAGETNKILIQYGKPGTAEVIGGDYKKRKIEVYVNTSTKLNCIDNVYNERRYIDNEGTY